ncbi:unnamed protein product, partial [Effrenium voratum]
GLGSAGRARKYPADLGGGCWRRGRCGASAERGGGCQRQRLLGQHGGLPRLSPWTPGGLAHLAAVQRPGPGRAQCEAAEPHALRSVQPAPAGGAVASGGGCQPQQSRPQGPDPRGGHEGPRRGRADPRGPSRRWKSQGARLTRDKGKAPVW